MQYQIGDWLVNTVETTITHFETQKVVKLEPIATELLTLLAENSGQIVTRDELFEKIWNGRIISDHAIYRVITKLRKALSPEDKNAYIVTISKRGYKLIRTYKKHVEYKKTFSDNEKPNETLEPTSPNAQTTYKLPLTVKKKNLILILSSLALLVFTVVILTNDKNKSLPTYNVTTPLTTKTGVETNPVYLENSKLLFAHQIDENSPANIFIKDLRTGLVERITNNNTKEDNLTASTDGKYIAFTRSNKNGCDVILLEKENNNYREKNLFECNTLYTEFSDLALSNNGDTLYYIYETAGSHQIFSHFISTGRKAQISKLDNNEYIGEISIALSPDNSKLAFIRLQNWESSVIGVIDTATNKEETLFKVKAFIDSIAWSKDNIRLYFIKGEKSVHSISLSNQKQHIVLSSIDADLRKVYSSPFTNSIIIHKNSNAISRGIWEASNPLVSEILTSSKLIITSNELDNYPSYANKSNQIAFVSFRSGSQQIWIKDEEGKERRLTNFTDARIIDHLNWSPDDSQILSLGNKEIYSVNPVNGNTVVYLTLEKYGTVAHATWSNDGKSIYFSSDMSGDMQIHSINIVTGEVSQLSKNGGVIAFASNMPNELYIIKAHQNGLWKFNFTDNIETLLFEDIDQESYGGVSISNGTIYYHSNKGSIRNYNTNTGSISDIELDKLPDVQYFSVSQDEKTFIFYERNITETSIVLASEKKLEL